MTINKHIKYIVRIIVCGIIGFHIGLTILLNIPAVQKQMATFISAELKKLLNTEVSVGHVELGLFNRIHVENVLLNGLEGEELLKVNRLSARFELRPLLNGKIVINSVQLIGFNACLKKDTPESIPNFQFVLDAFASKDTIKKNPNLDLRINSILINHGNLTYDILSEPQTTGRFNPSHIGLNNISASVSLKALENDSINAIIRRISFEEQSGFNLKKLGMKMVANNEKLTINDFNLKLPNTHLKLDSVLVRFDSLQNLPKLTEDVHYSGEMSGEFALNDLSTFVPTLAALDIPISCSLSFKGQGKKAELSTFSLYAEKHLDINAYASVQDWDKGDDMYLNARLINLSFSQTGITYLMNGLQGSTPPVLRRLKFIELGGFADGYLRDLQLNASVHSALGWLNGNLLINKDENEKRTYSGRIASSNMNLGRLLGDKKMGNMDFNVMLDGFTYQNQQPESSIKGIISSLEYSGYTYENILLDGIYKNGGFNGHLSLDDENGFVEANGAFNLSKPLTDINIRVNVKNLRPHELNLSDKYVDSDISLKLSADFSGTSINDMQGKILLDSLTLNAPAGQGYFLDNLSIVANNLDGEREMNIHSSFMTASLRGNYSFQTIPENILRIAKRYIPSLISTKSKKSRKAENNFRFNIQMYDTELLQKMFFIPIELHMTSHLSGYFNDYNDQIYIQGSFPSFTYNGTLYESASLLCENPSDQLSIQGRGSMLMNSGAMLNLSLDTKAKDDRLKTTLNWGNNTDVTYGGQFSNITRFHRTKGKSPILQADIEILPTKVILNDTIWNIHSSHIAIDSGRVFIDNFLAEHAGKHLRIDGKITKEETDSCRIDLKDIDVQYILDIVSFDDVEFGGLATGTVNLKQVLASPTLQTRLNVRNFAVNKGLMGNADIRGVWDNELPGIRLDAQIAEKGISSTHVTGYVSPKLKALDLMIEADSTNIGLLTPYVEGIFSELNGRVTGDVRLFGGFKTLDFEGKVSAVLDTKVDVLNTYLQVRNDSVHIRPGEFALDNVRIYDREGNTGFATGALRHTHLKNLNYDFNINANNLLMYNTTDPGDMLFYGKVYGTGNVNLQGGNNAMNIDVNLTTGRNTTFTYVTGLTAEATNNQFITFIDKTPKRIQDEVRTNFYHYTDARKKKEETGPSMDLRIKMAIDATSDATMKVIMDPVAGDNITARGNGNFNVDFYNKGNFSMFGDYVIDEGQYKLSMQEVIRKDFNLQSGSTVTFTGDPYQANLNVKAAYTVNSVSLSDLTPDASLNQSTVKVNCIMNLTGSLANPTIKFDLELPMVSEEDRELVRSATSTEEQMNTQIIYLLGIGKFYAYDYGNNTNQSNATSSLAFSTLSGQLNNMLSQVMENKNWNIGANLSTGQEGWSNVEAEAILSGRLLNNRLIVNGNFGYRENVLANTNFVGDFEAIWLLNKNGDFRLRGYNQTNDRYFTKSTLTTQGIGFIYKKDFNAWNELYQWMIRKRKQKNDK